MSGAHGEVHEYVFGDIEGLDSDVLEWKLEQTEGNARITGPLRIHYVYGVPSGASFTVAINDALTTSGGTKFTLAGGTSANFLYFGHQGFGFSTGLSINETGTSEFGVFYTLE